MIYNYKYLMEIRFKNSMSQSMLAQKLNLSIRQVSRLENGINFLSVENLIKYCEIFKDFNINKLFINEKSEGDNENVGE